MRLALRRATLLGGLVATLASLIAVGVAALAASAASAAPIALDAPDNGNAPLVAYDPTTQTTYVAWSDPASTGIDLCILPPAAGGCEGGAPVLLTNASAFPAEPPSLGSLAVLPGGEAVVIGIEKASDPIAYVSSAGGSAFLTPSQGRQNGGEPLADVDDFYQEDNVAPLSSTDMALLGGFSVGDDDFFDTSLMSAAPALTYPNANPSSQYVYNVAGTGSSIAAESAPAPAATGEDVVVDVGASSSGPAIPGCVNDDATGYGVVVGTVDGTSAGAGDLNGKVSSGGGGLQGYSLLECAANAPVLAQGGQDGIGLLEEEGPCISGAGSGIGLYYHPFNATATGGSFGPGVKLADVTNETLCGVGTLELAEDSSTGVYGEWTDGQGLVLDYSGNGGANWEPPVIVPEPAGGPQGNPTIVGTGGGNAEIAYVGNPGTGPQVFLEPVNYAALYAAEHAPAATTLTTTQTSGAESGASITISAGTVGETDHATIAGANAAGASGTVDYALFSASSCTASSKVFSSTGAVTSGAAAPSGAITTALAPGTYYWQSSYSGDSANLPSASACGSEVLTVAPATPSSEFKVEVIVANSGGTITITIVVTQSGKATLTVTISTSTLAHSAAVDAKAKKCKHGQIKLKGKCVSATTVVGKTSANATAGVPLKLTVNLSNKIKALLKKGKTVHLTGTLTFQSALGGKPTTHTYNLTVKGHKSKHKK
jgi:hypothetical protein